MIVFLGEDLRMMGVASRFDGGKRGKCVLRCRKMLLENHTALKERCNARHTCVKKIVYSGAANSVDEKIQHQFFAVCAVHEADRRTDGKGSL